MSRSHAQRRKPHLLLGNISWLNSPDDFSSFQDEDESQVIDECVPMGQSLCKSASYNQRGA